MEPPMKINLFDNEELRKNLSIIKKNDTEKYRHIASSLLRIGVNSSEARKLARKLRDKGCKAVIMESAPKILAPITHVLRFKDKEGVLHSYQRLEQTDGQILIKKVQY